MSRPDVLCALVLAIGICSAADVMSATAKTVETSTVSPIADMAMMPVVKPSTERPKATEMKMTNDGGVAAAAAAAGGGGGGIKPEEKSTPGDTQRHTVADFIIHPLIAFKPRTPDDDVPAASGRQSAASSTTPSPWQIFGFNPGQGLGSLAGTVTGWLNDRIQLPGLVDTPVRETTTTTSTTTTQRPDIVVRVQQRTTRRPFIALSNNNNRPNRFNNNNNNFGFNSDEIDDEEYDYVPPRRFNRRRFQNNNDLDEEDEDSQEYYDNRDGSYHNEDDDSDNGHDAEEDGEEEHSEEEEDDNEPAEEEEEENYSQRPNNRRRPLRNNNSRRGGNNKQNYRRRPQPQHDDDSDENDYYYNNNRPSTKRSQSPSNFIQRGQQSLINQIRQLTRVQTPAEVGTLLRQPLAAAAAVPIAPSRQQATLFVNRNGQTVYMAPELTAASAAVAPAPQYQLYANNVPLNLRAGQFPQPPLTKPLRVKGQPTQYITIPWNQLGISPPQRVTKLATDLQAEPHILNIPQSAINAMQNPNHKSTRPIITAEAVPLLAEASIMDIFQPPQIPPSRSTIAAVSNTGATKFGSTLPNAAVITAKATAPSISATPIVVVPQRIRGATLIEKAPALDKDTTAAESNSHKGGALSAAAGSVDARNPENEYILVGEDGDPGLTRQVQPVFGDARYIRVSDVQPYAAPSRARYGIRKNGRALAVHSAEKTDDADDKPATTEQHIPVEIISDKPTESQSTHSEMEMRAAEKKVIEDGAAITVPMPVPVPVPVPMPMPIDDGESSQIADAVKT